MHDGIQQRENFRDKIRRNRVGLGITFIYLILSSIFRRDLLNRHIALSVSELKSCNDDIHVARKTRATCMSCHISKNGLKILVNILIFN